MHQRGGGIELLDEFVDADVPVVKQIRAVMDAVQEGVAVGFFPRGRTEEMQFKGQAFRVKHVPLKVNSTAKAKSDETEVTVIVRTAIGEGIKVEGEQVKAEIDVRDLPEGEYLRWVKVQLPDHVHLVRVIPPFARVEVLK